MGFGEKKGLPWNNISVDGTHGEVKGTEEK